MNLKSENTQGYAQKPQRNCTFMNSASGFRTLLFVFPPSSDSVRHAIRQAGSLSCMELRPQMHLRFPAVGYQAPCGYCTAWRHFFIPLPLIWISNNIVVTVWRLLTVSVRHPPTEKETINCYNDAVTICQLSKSWWQVTVILSTSPSPCCIYWQSF